MAHWKMSFAVNLELKLFRSTVANANIELLKSIPTLYDTCLDHMLVKFEQIKIYKIVSFLREKGVFKTTFDKALIPFWKTFL